MGLFTLAFGLYSLYSAVSGVKKGIEGAYDLSEAKDRKLEAAKLSEAAKTNMENANLRAMNRLEKLANAKAAILSSSMCDFIDNFEKIKNVNFKETEGISEIKNHKEYKQELLEIKDATLQFKDIFMTGAASVVLGSLASTAVKSAVLKAVTKKGLAGAAASNHALALIGGGSKAMGGLGMAGGAKLLKGFSVASSISLAGSLFASKAKQKLNEAESEYLQAEAVNEQAVNTCIVLNGIMVRASQLCGILQILDKFFVISVNNLCDIIENSGTDYNKYSADDKKAVYACVQLAITIKSILDTSLLNENGELEQQSMESLEKGQAYIAMLEAV